MKEKHASPRSAAKRTVPGWDSHTTQVSSRKKTNSTMKRFVFSPGVSIHRRQSAAVSYKYEEKYFIRSSSMAGLTPKYGGRKKRMTAFLGAAPQRAFQGAGGGAARVVLEALVVVAGTRLHRAAYHATRWPRSSSASSPCPSPSAPLMCALLYPPPPPHPRFLHFTSLPHSPPFPSSLLLHSP